VLTRGFGVGEIFRTNRSVGLASLKKSKYMQ